MLRYTALYCALGNALVLLGTIVRDCVARRSAGVGFQLVGCTAVDPSRVKCEAFPLSTGRGRPAVLLTLHCTALLCTVLHCTVRARHCAVRCAFHYAALGLSQEQLGRSWDTGCSRVRTLDNFSLVNSGEPGAGEGRPSRFLQFLRYEMEERELDIQVGELTIGMFVRNVKSVVWARLGEVEQPAIGTRVTRGSLRQRSGAPGLQRGAYSVLCQVAAWPQHGDRGLLRDHRRPGGVDAAKLMSGIKDNSWGQPAGRSAAHSACMVCMHLPRLGDDGPANSGMWPDRGVSIGGTRPVPALDEPGALV